MMARDEDILDDLLFRWEELSERGQDTPASELAKEHPSLIEELDRRIARLKAAAWLDKPLDDNPPPNSDPPHLPVISPRILADRYRLDELIAEGGFAQVFRAYDCELQRTVAIKLPKPSQLESADAFLAEARRVARLKHPGIVQVYDFGIDGSTCFIVSEYVEGGSLADHLVRQRPSSEQVLKWIAAIGEALEYAHLNGVVHRDIKPANILIDHHGRALLADFGIAQSASKTGRFAPSLGTLRYMSPEQLEGKPSDHRSDIYSLAVVLHEALTGRIPYSSMDPNVLRKEIVSGAASKAAELTGTLKAVCQKALSRSLHERHASATSFAADILRASVPQRRAGLLKGAAALGLLLLLVVGVLFTTGLSLSLPDATAPQTLSEKLAIAKNDLFHEQYAAAEAGFSDILRIDPRNLTALDGRGFSRLNQKKLNASVEDFTAALELAPDDPSILRHRASAYAALREFDKAIADLQKNVRLLPGTREAAEQLADAYALRSHDNAEQGRFQEAADDMTEAIALSPDTPVNYRRRASCWFHLENYDKALEDMTIAIAKQPREPEYYEKRAMCFQRLGRSAEAEEDLTKAKTLRDQ